jgi:hypothetical protein
MVLLVTGLSGSLQPARAQGLDPVALIAKISVDPSVGGTAIGAAAGTIDGVSASIDEASWADTHSSASPLFEAGVGIRAGSFAEILGLFNYGRAGAGDSSTGEVGGVPLLASFDNYEFRGLEGGVRVRRASGVGPYATFTAGVRWVNELRARLRVDTTVRTVTVYKGSAVPSFAFGGGMLWGDDGFAIGFEAALRYAGSPDVPADRAFQPADGAGSRWSLPIGLVFKF